MGFNVVYASVVVFTVWARPENFVSEYGHVLTELFEKIVSKYNNKTNLLKQISIH